MTLIEAIALIFAGLLVGFINTLAGGGTIISLSMLMFLGLPAPIANGTNRIAVILQNLIAVKTFRGQKILDLKKGKFFAIPAAAGSIGGAFAAANVDAEIFTKVIAMIMLCMMFFILFKPDKWLKGHDELIGKKISLKQIVLFFLIGFYGGFIHIGVGFFTIAGLVISGGYDLIKANAIKNLIVLLYTPFALIVYIINDQVRFDYGLILSIGNISGAWIASKYAIKWGTNFIRWLIIIIIIISASHLLEVIDLGKLFVSLN